MTSVGILTNDSVVVVDHTKYLLQPVLFEYLDFTSLTAFRELSKFYKDSLDCRPEDVAYWKAMCSAFSYFSGLYIPNVLKFEHNISSEYKKHFFNDLWAARSKWSALNVATTTDLQVYKIKVACRFRPGQKGTDKLALPLHQFLKIKRQQRLLPDKSEDEAAAKENKAELFVGEHDPEEFVDPILGNLMREPVLLTPSNRIIDRSVALQCILRGGRDPFTNDKLTTDMLIPQPELTSRIQEWRVKKETRDDRLDIKEVQTLFNEGDVDPDLLDALMEVERINAAVKRSKFDISHPNSEHSETDAFNDMFPINNNVNGVNYEHANGNAQQNADNDLPQIPNDNQENLPPTAATNQNTLFQSETSAFEKRKNETARVIDISESKSHVAMNVPGAGVRPFHFNTVYDGEIQQEKVFDKSAMESISAVLNGFNSCILCYGQTGSGKTYTFFGPETEIDQLDHIDSTLSTTTLSPSTGIVLRTCAELLQAKERMALNGINVSFTAQFIEIYEEQVTDLLTGKAVSIRRESGELVGALEATLDSMEQVVSTLRTGHTRKRFAATAMNDRSSRSHTAFVIQVLQTLNPRKLQDKLSLDNYLCDDKNDKLLKSQLHLVDLAGSERIKKSKVTGTQLKEAVGINSSLLVLGKVISALVTSQHHVPYYESKLTTLLKAAFGGNSRTTAVINCRMDDTHGDETLQSLRFGERCGMISNSMRQTASSFTSALTTIDNALTLVKSQILTLEQRNKQHLASYKNLVNSCQDLQRKRNELVAINGNQKNELVAVNGNQQTLKTGTEGVSNVENVNSGLTVVSM